MGKICEAKPETLLIAGSNRKVRALYRWLSRVTGLEACWIEGSDEYSRPLWGFIKRIAKQKFAVVSRRVAIASLLLTPLVLSSQVTAQTAVELSELDGTTGTTFIGVNANDFIGRQTAIGDINGDGIGDLIIGSNSSDVNGANSGSVFVVFGSSSGFSSSTNLSSLNGSTGFVLNGISSGDAAGESIAAGDINGDGIEDIIIGAPNGEYNGVRTGEAYVVFGKTSAFSSSIDISALIDGTNGFLLNGVDSNDNAGTGLASGDINGDGIADVIIGADDADPNGSGSAGESYVVFGQNTAFASSIDLSALDGSTGFRINGEDANDRTGTILATGDINGDSFDDILIGVPAGNYKGTNTGESYVVFGASSFSGSSAVELSALDGTTGFVLNGQSIQDNSGSALASGDINGDGIEDVIIGAPGSDPNGDRSGATHVFFGQTTTFASAIDLSTLDGSAGFTLNGISNNHDSGFSVATGDVNGDGIGDVITGAYYAAPNDYYSGQSYVVFGDTAAFSSSIDLSSLDGDTGFALNGAEAYNYAAFVTSSGDLNGDGIDDIIIGIPGGSSYAGEVAVFFNAIPKAITGNEGFRTLAAPSNGTVFDELLGGFWTQGFTNSDDNTDPTPDANAFTWDEASQDWTALTDQDANSLSAGNGFLFYVFSDDNWLDDGDAGFPKYISANQFGGDGSVNSGSINPVSDLADSDFFFAGNPYFYPIDWDLLTKSGLSNTVYVYDDANSTWQSWNGSVGNITDGELSAFQGFFIQGSGGSGSLTIEESDIISNSVSLLKQGDTEPKALKIHAEAGEFSADAWLSFQEGGEAGRDTFDGQALTPLASNYLRLATIIGNEDKLQINALPIDYNEELRFPMDLSGVVDSSVAQVSFEGLEDFEDWTITIQDLDTEEVFELSQDDTLSLVIRSAQAKTVGAPASPVSLKAKTDGHRFELVLTPVIGVTNTQPDPSLPEQITLEQNYPNPFNPGTRILFEVPGSGIVTLEVFNLVGQKVAELVNEQKPAGRYEVTFDASALSSGVYVYRLSTAGQQLTRKMTLIK